MRGGWFEQRPLDEEDKLNRADAQSVLRRLGRLLHPYRRQILVATLLLVGQTACLLAGPALVRYGIDNGVARIEAGWATVASDWDMKIFRDSDGDGSSVGETDQVGASLGVGELPVPVYCQSSFAVEPLIV